MLVLKDYKAEINQIQNVFSFKVYFSLESLTTNIILYLKIRTRKIWPHGVIIVKCMTHNCKCASPCVCEMLRI
jgi:hypothetical protein